MCRTHPLSVPIPSKLSLRLLFFSDRVSPDELSGCPEQMGTHRTCPSVKSSHVPIGERIYNVLQIISILSGFARK
jgi:hypothetical protein